MGRGIVAVESVRACTKRKISYRNFAKRPLVKLHWRMYIMINPKRRGCRPSWLPSTATLHRGCHPWLPFHHGCHPCLPFHHGYLSNGYAKNQKKERNSSMYATTFNTKYDNGHGSGKQTQPYCQRVLQTL